MDKYMDLDSGKFLQEVGIDGQKWAKAFMEIKDSKPSNWIDEGLMLGWFCNAIMAGYDAGVKKGEASNE